MSAYQPTALGRFSTVLLVIVIGVPTVYLLILGTWGVVLVPLVVAFYAVPWFLFHYALWGQALSRQKRDDAILKVQLGAVPENSRRGG